MGLRLSVNILLDKTIGRPLEYKDPSGRRM